MTTFEYRYADGRRAIGGPRGSCRWDNEGP